MPWVSLVEIAVWFLFSVLDLWFFGRELKDAEADREGHREEEERVYRYASKYVSVVRHFVFASWFLLAGALIHVVTVPVQPEFTEQTLLRLHTIPALFAAVSAALFLAGLCMRSIRDDFKEEDAS